MASERNKGEDDVTDDSRRTSSDGQNDDEEPKNVSSMASDGNRTPSVRRKLRTLTFGRRYKTKNGSGKDLAASKKRKGPWNFKFNYRLRREPAPDIPEPNVGCDSCVCTGYRRTEEHHLGAGVVFRAAAGEKDAATMMISTENRTIQGNPSPIIDLSRFNPDEYPIEDWEERARAERARELEEGVDPPPGYRPASPVLASSSFSSSNSSSYPNSQQLSHLMTAFDIKLTDLAATLQSRLAVNPPRYPLRVPVSSSSSSLSPHSTSAATSASVTAMTEPFFSEINLVSQFVMSHGGSCAVTDRTVHTQVDYIHCLVPDLLEITNCSFYWGKMDRYEAERLLETKPEGTFLLRDSAQEEYLFSVSFRRYSRSLHARIEQWNHKFSFDSHDPGVFASGTVCGLIEHYKDPTCCMFFEPMLTIPLHRTFPFPLQHLSRSVICKATTYDGINSLRLPKSLKGYLKEYHYKQRVRVRMFEVEH